MMFFKPQAKSGGVEWLLVGLGNPGEQYEHTRHNVGFLVVDELAKRLGVPVRRLKHKALVQQVVLGGRKVLLMKPMTYMNLSGEAVADAASFFKISPQHILVICDDVALPPGKLRIRRKGSDGGHKGLRSIAQALGTDEYPRLRLGVGEKPHPDYDMADWVLARLTGQDKQIIEEAVVRAADAVECFFSKGPDQAMASYN